MGAGFGEIPAAERGYDGALLRGYDGKEGVGVAVLLAGRVGSCLRRNDGWGREGAWVLGAARYPRQARV